MTTSRFLLFFVTSIVYIANQVSPMSFVLGVWACKLGDDPILGFNRENDSGGKWFLNTQNPASCSGSVNDYNISFYTSGMSSGSTYNVTLAVWKRLNSTFYEKVQSSMIMMILYHDEATHQRSSHAINVI